MNQELTIEVVEVGEITSVKVLGDLVASSSEEFKASILKLFVAPCKEVRINLVEIRFADSSGLGACMALHKASLKKGCRLILIEPSVAVRELFELTHANRIFHIETSETIGG